MYATCFFLLSDLRQDIQRYEAIFAAHLIVRRLDTDDKRCAALGLEILNSTRRLMSNLLLLRYCVINFYYQIVHLHTAKILHTRNFTPSYYTEYSTCLHFSLHPLFTSQGLFVYLWNVLEIYFNLDISDGKIQRSGSFIKPPVSPHLCCCKISLKIILAIEAHRRKDKHNQTSSDIDKCSQTQLLIIILIFIYLFIYL